MIRKLLLGALLATLATPSMAGVNLMCSGGEGISADFPMGGGVGLNFLGATVSVGDDFWTADLTVSGGTQIVPSQAIQVDNRYYIELADPGMSKTLVRVQLFYAAGVDEPVWAGTLEVTDVGAYALSCNVG